MSTEDIQKIETGDSVKVKQIFDESANDAVKEAGYDINYNSDNIKLILMFVSCLFALTAQFFPIPFPDSRLLLGVCCFSYFALSTVLQYIITFVDKDTIVTTKQKEGDANSFFRVRATFPKYQEYYTVIVESAAKDANPTHKTTAKMYVGKYFTEEGEFDQIGFMKDIKRIVQRWQQKKYTEIEFNHKSD